MTYQFNLRGSGSTAPNSGPTDGPTTTNTTSGGTP